MYVSAQAKEVPKTDPSCSDDIEHLCTKTVKDSDVQERKGERTMKKFSPLVVVLLLVGSLSVTLSSPETMRSSSLEIVGQSVLGFASVVASLGNVTYASFGSALVAIDTSDQGHPRVLGRAFIPNCPDGKMARWQDYLYVPWDIYGLAVFDISQPHQPVYRCTYGELDPNQDPNEYRNNHNAGGVEIVGNYVYWANRNSNGRGLTILAANPPSSDCLETYPRGVPCPDCLTRLGEYRKTDTEPDLDKRIDWAFGVHVVGDIAYLCTRSTGVAVLNVEDKTHPTFLKKISTKFAIDMVSSGRYGYLADGPGYIIPGETPYPLKVIDLSTNEVVAKFQPPNPDPTTLYYRSVVFYENYLYVASGFRGVDVIRVDTWDPDPPALIFVRTIQNSSAEKKPWYSAQLSLSGSYLYVTDSMCADGPKNGLKIYSLSDPSNPQLVTSVNHVDSSRDVALLNGYAYVAYGAQGLAIVDVRDPLNPLEEASYDINSGTTLTEAVFAAQGHLFVADGKEGFKIFRVSDPLEPEMIWNSSELGNECPKDVRDIQVIEQGQRLIAYLGDFDHGKGGLWKIDVTGVGQTGFRPTVIAHVKSIGYVKKVHQHGDWVYVASNIQPIGCTNYNGLRVVNDQSLSVVTWLKDGYERISDVDATDIGGRTYAFAATSGGPSPLPGILPPPESQLHILENINGALSEPFFSPIKFQGAYFGDELAAVEVVGDRAYINHENTGIYVYDISPLGEEPPAIPQRLAYKKLTCNNNSYEIHLFGDYLYDAHGDSGLYILRFTP